MRRSMVSERRQYATEEAWLLVGLWDMSVRVGGQKERGYLGPTLSTIAPDPIQLRRGYSGR